MRIIRIETNGSILPREWRFFLGDVEISGFVSSVNIGLDMDSLPSISVTLVGKLELPDEIKGLVTVFVEAGGE